MKKMGRLKKYKPFSIVDHIKRYFSITPYQDIISWSLNNIDFSDQISAQRNKLDFEQYPYQVPIIKQWQMKKGIIKTITVVAVEQIGKTNMFVVGLLYNMLMNPCQSLVVYQSDDRASQTNQTKLLPLMKHIPILKQELQKPRSYKKDCYRFSNLISMFQGAGTKIVSKSCKIVVGDEVQAWKSQNNNDSVADLKKRTRSYNESICFLISSPKYPDGDIWQSFLRGSRGYWYLRCKGCNELTMRSCDTHNLQFEADYDQKTGTGVVKKDTIRLICPKCKHQHTEVDKKWMNVNGGFIHQIPQRLQTDPSFQLGALASQLPSLSWDRIAKEQLESGKTSELKQKQNFANSWKGLPYISKKVQKVTEDSLYVHEWNVKQIPSRDQMQMIFVTADTQDDRSVVAVWGWSTSDNLYLLKTAQPKYLSINQQQRTKINQANKKIALQTETDYVPIETVEDIINAQYLIEDGVGIQPIFCLIDMRGHRMSEVEYFIKHHYNVLGWLGGRMSPNNEDHFEPSKTKYHTILADAKWWQKEAIYHLYDQKKRTEDYLYFYPDVQKRVTEQILACKPDPNVKWGFYPQNWSFGERIHDYFDVTKMAYCAREYAIKKIQLKRFRYCKSILLNRYREEQIRIEKIKSTIKGQTNQPQKQLQKKWLDVN